MRRTVPTPDNADRPRVLLVEPHEQTRVLLAQILVDAGFDVVAAVPNYAQAIVGVRTHQPTVIVTELYGGTVLSPEQYIVSLRRHCQAPVIVHSTKLPDAIQSSEWGLWGTVEKGDQPGGLLSMVVAAHALTRRFGS